MDKSEAEFLVFDEKLKWLRIKLEEIRIPWTEGSDTITINSFETIIEDSLFYLDKINFHREIKIVFRKEKVLDAGGVIREWIRIVLKKLFSLEKGNSITHLELFVKSQTKEFSYIINPELHYTNDHKMLYRLAGRVIGKAMFEKIPIEPSLNRILIKHLLGEKISATDMRYYDENLFSSWKYILENPEDLDLNFVLTHKKGGMILEESLIPNGSKVQINKDNCKKYLELSKNFIFYDQLQPALEIFLDEFHKVIPTSLLSPFSDEELELVITGIPFLDVSDWRHNTIYKGVYTASHQVVNWFWEILQTFPKEKLEHLLKFCTGSTKVSVEGFSKLESNRGVISLFCIESTNYSTDSNIKAHTCFNRLALPIFPSKEKLESSLNSILEIDFDGIFGME